MAASQLHCFVNSCRMFHHIKKSNQFSSAKRDRIATLWLFGTMESRLPSWVLKAGQSAVLFLATSLMFGVCKAAVASVGAVAVLALLRKYQSEAGFWNDMDRGFVADHSQSAGQRKAEGARAKSAEVSSSRSPAF